MSHGAESFEGKEAGKRLMDFAAHAREVDIISPFISEAGVDRLLSALKGRRRLTLRNLTRAEPQDVIQDVISPAALERLIEFATDGDRSAEIRRHPYVHAKLYLFDDRAAIIGFANLTEPWLTGGNFELCCLVTNRARVAYPELETALTCFDDESNMTVGDLAQILGIPKPQKARLYPTVNWLAALGRLHKSESVPFVLSLPHTPAGRRP